MFASRETTELLLTNHESFHSSVYSEVATLQVSYHWDAFISVCVNVYIVYYINSI